MKLTRMEWTEIVLIVVALVVAWLTVPVDAWSLPFGKVVGYSAALLLAQSLVRDVVRLWVDRNKEGAPKRRIGCLCAESTIGLLMVVIAIGLSLIGISQAVTVGRMEVTIAGAVLLFGGFFAKDFIVIVRREKDHGSVVVW